MHNVRRAGCLLLLVALVLAAWFGWREYQRLLRDQPAYADTSPPDCRGLDDIDGEIAEAQSGEYYCPYPIKDGVESDDSDVRRYPACFRGGADDGGNPDNASGGAKGKSAPDVLAGSTAELDFVRSILAYQTGTDPGDVSDLGAATLAPILRGNSVVLR